MECHGLLPRPQGGREAAEGGRPQGCTPCRKRGAHAACRNILIDSVHAGPYARQNLPSVLLTRGVANTPAHGRVGCVQRVGPRAVPSTARRTAPNRPARGQACERIDEAARKSAERVRFVLLPPCIVYRLTCPTEAIVRSLEDNLSVLSVELIPIHQRLVTIRRQLVALAAKAALPSNPYVRRHPLTF